MTAPDAVLELGGDGFESRAGLLHRVDAGLLSQEVDGGLLGQEMAALPAGAEVDWEHLRTTEKGRHSPLAALAKQAAPA
ncbi:hypothetical protein [Streptomyces achromogenes]|uniref:hypothetical protein n=1 Tax=Streptomyces achromogenes TaxID=67255 RepID=UPI0012FEAC17|nr:hypothetical protein [Streptomyces achromogenes]